MKFVSIVGDSISTYEGYNPYGFAVYYDRGMQELNGLHSVYDAWWAKVNQRLRAYLCVNNSYSGSRVSGKIFPAGESEERILNLRTDKYNPDIILIYIGFNDFGNGISIRHDSVFRRYRNDSDTFEDAYNNMLRSIKKYYQNATVACGTLMRTVIKYDSEWSFPERLYGIPYEDYNDAIRRACRDNGCHLADLTASDIRYETLDGTHPTIRGHDTIAGEWIKSLGALGFLND